MANTFAWKPSDVSTFYQQSQNLQKQAGSEGLQTGQQQVQQQTAQKKQQVGQTGQNIALGAQQVAQGANAQPVIAYNPQTANQSQPQILGSTYTTGTPDTTITNTAQLTLPTGNQGAQFAAPAVNFPTSMDLTDLANQTNQANFANTYNQALGQITSQTPVDVATYQNQLQNQLVGQKQAYDVGLANQQAALTNIQNQKQSQIADYINQLQGGLNQYQQNTSNLTNIGQLSAAEQQSANLNAALANSGAGANAQALAALTGGQVGVNSRLGVLGQQAQSGALLSAEEQAALNQAQSQVAQQQLAAGQQAQQTGYTNAANTITNTQANLSNTLASNVQATQQQLQQAHDQATQYLSQQEQASVQQAAQTLKASNITPQRIQSAAQQWTNLVDNYADKNKDNPDTLKNILKSYLQVWQASTSGQDMNFSHNVASIFQPTVDKINSYLNNINVQNQKFKQRQNTGGAHASGVSIG